MCEREGDGVKRKRGGERGRERGDRERGRESREIMVKREKDRDRKGR